MNPVYECLRAERRDFFKLLLNKRTSIRGRIEDILEITRRKRISVDTVDKNFLSNIAEHHQGVALEVSKYPYTDIKLHIVF